MVWKNIHPSSLDADTPYDTLQLTDLRNRSIEAGTNFGRANTFWIGGKYGTIQDYRQCRPFVSVTGYACLAAIPWYVPRNLKRLKCDLWLRISNAKLDDTRGESGPLLPVDINVRFLKNGSAGGALFYPLIDAGNGAVWQRVAIDYELGEWTGGSQGGFWDYLVLEFKSQIESNVGTSDVTGNIGKSGIGNRKSYRVLADTAGFYAEGATPAPQGFAPETMATLASEYGVTTPYRVLGVWDHVLSADAGKSMVCWPPNELLVTEAQWVWKVPASYLQVASISVQEVFDDDLTNVEANEVLSLQPAYYSAPFALAADVNDVLSRPEVASAVSQGWPADSSAADGGAKWNNRKYLKRCRATRGGLPARFLVRQGSHTRLPVESFVLRAQLAGVFATGNYYQDETYAETASKSIVGHVTVRATIIQWVGGSEIVVADSGDVVRRLVYVISNKLSKSRWLYNAAWLNKSDDDEPDAFCYGEGLLNLAGAGATTGSLGDAYTSAATLADDDTAVLTDKDGSCVLEFYPTGDFDYRRPYSVRLSVEVTDGPGGKKPNFLDSSISTLRTESDKSPMREAMQVFCVAQGLFTKTAPPIAAGDFNFRGQIRARDLRGILDAQNRARQVWGRRLVLDFDDDLVELDSPSESQVNYTGGQGLDRIDFEFRPVRPEILAAAAPASDKTNFTVEMVAHVGSSVTVIAKFYSVVEGGVTSNTPAFTLTASGSNEWVHTSKIVELDSSPPGEVESYRVRIFAKGEGGTTLDYLAIGEPDTISPAEVGAHRLGADTFVAPVANSANVSEWSGYEAGSILGGAADMARDEFGARVNAVSFDGAADSHSASLDPGTSPIYAVAFSYDVSDATQRNILHHRVGALVNTACRLYVQSGNLYVETRQGGVLTSTLVRSVVATTWYDVVVVLAPGVRRVYVNGVLEVDAAPGALPVGSGTCFVGRGASGGYFDGKIALVDVISGWDKRGVERYIMRRRQMLGSY